MFATLPCVAVLSMAAAVLPCQSAFPMGGHRMVLDCPGGELPFFLSIDGDGAGGLTAFVRNGTERIEVPEVSADEAIVLRFPHYDSELVLEVVEGETVLAGHWIKRRGDQPETRMAVRSSGWGADAPRRRFAGAEDGGADAFAGRYRVAFSSSKDAAVGIFGAVDGLRSRAVGTFLTTLGDYRYLAGNVVDGELRLSCFDGAHAFLFHARRVDGGALEGDFWSSDSWHETWTAERDDDAQLVDGWGLTALRDDADIEAVGAQDLDGARHTLGDEGLAGEVRVIEVFGSWCPNCHDHGAYMAELHRRFGPRGLEVVGIAFEHRGDFERSVRQVRAFAERHGVTYPLWIGGVSDKSKATDQFGVLDRIRSYPTTLFIDRRGKVRGVYQGWSGPAAGEAHARLRDRFEQLIEQLLSERR